MAYFRTVFINKLQKADYKAHIIDADGAVLKGMSMPINDPYKKAHWTRRHTVEKM